jgi:CubicO group peptidase (beta-lactamase class C family)
MQVEGRCETGFGRVADAFAAALESGRDVGGSVGVYLDGRPVVEIRGGLADPARGVPWAEHTITPIGSTSKALASTAVLILVDRGLLDLDEPVARYWPAFGQSGKEDIPVRLVLSHRSGVAALDAPISNDQAAALDPVLRLIEQQRPWWRPGTKHGYHAMTYGFILSGLVRAVTGRTSVLRRRGGQTAKPRPAHRAATRQAQHCGADDRPVAAPGNSVDAESGLVSVRPWCRQPALGIISSHVRRNVG